MFLKEKMKTGLCVLLATGLLAGGAGVKAQSLGGLLAGQVGAQEQERGWLSSMEQFGMFFMFVGLESAGLGNENTGAFSEEYSNIRNSILTRMENVRTNQKRIEGLIEYQAELLAAYTDSGVWAGDQNADQYCRDNVVLCKYLPYTFDQVQWD